MACNDCNDDNITDIPSGPPGPTGPEGPEGPPPTLSGTSSTSNSVGIGSKSFTTQADISWSVGQRIRATNTAIDKIIEGEITAYTGTTVTITADYGEGSGSDTSWILSIAGAVGATGAAGSNGIQGIQGYSSFGTTSGVATSLGSNQYNVPFLPNNPSTGNGFWPVVNQIIYIQSAGYYQVVAIVSPGAIITVLDLLYAGNSPSTMTSTGNLKVSPGGIKGDTGSTGATGATGSTGATGATGPSSVLTKSEITSTSVPTTTDLTFIASSTNTGKLVYYGELFLESDDAVHLTSSPRIDSTITTAHVTKHTGAAAIAGKSYITIPIMGIVSINAAQAFSVRITLNDYTKNSTIIGRISYNYQA